MSAAISTAYVWVTPAFVSGAPVDHTWVTTYNNQITPYRDVASVVASNAHYWFCWGDFHILGNPPDPLHTGNMNIALANCLVQANMDSRLSKPAQGTIFQYGRDGVCHQLANQVLWAATDSTGARLTVAGANGYKTSLFFFGEYGRQSAAWVAKKTSCSTSFGGGMGGIQMTGDQDDRFDKDAQKLLSPARYKKLKALRKKIGSDLERSSDMKINLMSAEQAATEINESINNYLQEVSKLLTPGEFETLFGFAPDQSIELVDPNMGGSNKAPGR